MNPAALVPFVVIFAPDLERFPAPHVAKEQYAEAKRRAEVAYSAWYNAEGFLEQRNHMVVRDRTRYARDVWGALYGAQSTLNKAERKRQLDYLQKRLGWPDYMAAQMPMPVYVPEEKPPPKAVNIAGK